MTKQAFSEQEIQAVYRVIFERRDVRHFNSKPVESEQLKRFIEAAHRGPSVGFMQPWRFVHIRDAALKEALYQHVNEERQLTAHALGERSAEFMKLKVEGILNCAEVLLVGLIDKREDYIFGRRTMPEMDLASASCAIQNFWLAARAEGIGVGWVSMFDPEKIREICKMPPGSRPIAILCVGHVDEFTPKPLLEMAAWDERRALQTIVYQDAWSQASDLF